MSLADVWHEFWHSVRKPPPPLPADPCDDPRVVRAQRETDEIQATLRMLQAHASARQHARREYESDC